jgi:predicted alpha-1,2-mannosidase
VQLAALLAPQQTSDAITSMLNDYAQSGQLPRWALPNGETYVTAGDPADPIIADAYAFGARDFDAQQALSDMVAQATQPNNVRQGEPVRDVYGYLPYDATYTGCCNLNKNYLVSTELEFDTADYSIASLASALGNPSVYSRFAARAQNWRNVFNPATGYVQARLENGQWAPGFSPGTSTGFEEGTSSQYTPMVPFNLKALIAAKGGNAAYSSFLDSLLTSLPNPGPANANLNDEPSIEIPWEYDYTAAPYKTQEIVREAQQQLYFDAPAGQFGNDDLGAMSSWFVWSNLGFYPETPGTGTLVLGSPVFPLTEIHLANGKTVTITAPNAKPDAPYVQSLTVGGKTWTKPWLTYADLSTGATLDYNLGTTPDTSWGTAPDAAPPSDGYGA